MKKFVLGACLALLISGGISVQQASADGYHRRSAYAPTYGNYGWSDCGDSFYRGNTGYRGNHGYRGDSFYGGGSYRYAQPRGVEIRLNYNQGFRPNYRQSYGGGYCPW